MIGWLGLIGRMLGFALEKLTGKVIDLGFDDRRRAARKLTSLHQAVSDLEVLTKEIIVELESISLQEDKSVEIEWLRNVATAVDETSQRFLETTVGLRDVLKIFDPILASTISDLEAHKFSFLILASDGFKLVDQNESCDEIVYTFPSERLDTLDLEEPYRWYKENYPLDSTKSLEWPPCVIHGFVEDEDVVQGRICIRDPHSMSRLAVLLKKHVDALSAARRGLGDFLRQNFKIEDLLAVQSPRKQFDRIHALNRMSDSVAIAYTRWFAGKPTRRSLNPRENQNEEAKGTKED